MSASGAIRAGAAYVEVFLEQNRITQGLAALQSRLRGWSASLSRLGANAYGGELPGPLAAIARFASSPAGIFSGLLTAVKMTAGSGAEIADLAEKAGTSVEAISSLAYAARRSHVEVDQLAGGIKKMQVNIVSAAQGGKEAQESLAAIGLSAAELSRLLPEQQFRRIADRIAAIQNPTERAAMAVKIFGRSGTDLLPLLLQGSDGISRWEARAKALGVVMTGEAADGARRFHQLLGDLNDVLQSGVKIIGGAMIPYLTTMTNRIVKIIAAVRDWIKDHRGLAVVLLQVSGAVVGAGVAMMFLSAVLRNIAGGIGVALGAVRLLSATVAMAGSLLATAWTAAVSAVSAVGAAFAALTWGQIAAFAAVWAGIAALLYFTGALGNTMSGVASAFRGLASDIMATFGAMGDALSAGDIALAAKVLWAMLKMEWQRGVHWINETWIGAKEIFLSVWTNAVYSLASMMTNAWAAIQQGWNFVVTGMSAAWTIFTDSVVSGWNAASNWISKRWIDLMALVGEYDPQTADAAKKLLDQDYGNDKKRRQRETQEKLAATGKDSENRRQQIESERAGAIGNLEQDRKATHEARQKQYAEDLRKSQEEVDVAKKEWDAARDQAAKARAAMNAQNTPEGGPGVIPDISGNVAAAMAKTKTVVEGTFSGYALAGLGSGNSVEEKMEKHLAKISESADRQNAALERLEQNMNAGLLLA